MDTRRALELAQTQGLDLAEISPTSNPPVCKILDYGKYKYEVKKKAQKAKKNQVVTLLKEVQFRPNTDTHDIEFKVNHIKRFLEEANKVKVSIRFRGREASHANLGHALLKQIVDMVGNLGNVEQTAKMEGKILSMIFGPVGKPSQKKVTAKPTAPAEAGKKVAQPAAAVAGQKVE
jgi:translation initiation factor IF-3